MLSATSRITAGMTWEYVFIVNPMQPCPSNSMIARGCFPRASKRLAAECRKS